MLACSGVERPRTRPLRRLFLGRCHSGARLCVRRHQRAAAVVGTSKVRPEASVAAEDAHAQAIRTLGAATAIADAALARPGYEARQALWVGRVGAQADESVMRAHTAVLRSASGRRRRFELRLLRIPPTVRRDTAPCCACWRVVMWRALRGAVVVMRRGQRLERRPPPDCRALPRRPCPPPSRSRQRCGPSHSGLWRARPHRAHEQLKDQAEARRPQPNAKTRTTGAETAPLHQPPFLAPYACVVALAQPLSACAVALPPALSRAVGALPLSRDAAPQGWPPARAAYAVAPPPSPSADARAPAPSPSATARVPPPFPSGAARAPPLSPFDVAGALPRARAACGETPPLPRAACARILSLFAQPQQRSLVLPLLPEKVLLPFPLLHAERILRLAPLLAQRLLLLLLQSLEGLL
eukprot:scaffold258666_cov22-Tisochrysis_lutea.AAC.1